MHDQNNSFQLPVQTMPQAIRPRTSLAPSQGGGTLKKPGHNERLQPYKQVQNLELSSNLLLLP